MEKNLGIELVNNVSVELHPFVEESLARTVVGAVSSLKGLKTYGIWNFIWSGAMSKSSSMGMNFHLPLSPRILSPTP